MIWNYLSIPKLQRLHRWSWEWISNFISHFTGYVINISMLGLKSLSGSQWRTLSFLTSEKPHIIAICIVRSDSLAPLRHLQAQWWPSWVLVYLQDWRKMKHTGSTLNHQRDEGHSNYPSTSWLAGRFYSEEHWVHRSTLWMTGLV